MTRVRVLLLPAPAWSCFCQIHLTKIVGSMYRGGMPPARPQGSLLDRSRELARLRAAWDAAARDAQFVAVQGRRRVGKTYLLGHFAAGRRALFFGATRQSEAVELRRLHEAVQRDMGSQVAALTGGGFQSWSAAFRFFFALAAQQRTVVVLDEIPYLTRSTPGFASILQYEWDHRPRDARLLLVTSGSALSTMTALFGPRGPLRGRPTETLTVEPLSAYEARAFLPALAPERFIEAYAACGGYPLHLERWDPRRSTDANLLALAGSAGGLLLDDAQSMVQEELAAISTHALVLSEIGRGRSTFSELSSRLQGRKIAYSLNLLEQTGFIRKATPLAAPKGARGYYEMGDAYLTFWYRVLASDVASIEAGQGAAVLARRREEWEKHVRWVFEEAARDHARRLTASGGLPRDMLLGRWWRHDRGLDVEIDVLGMQRGQTTLIGGARWSRTPLSLRAFTDLERAAAHVPAPATAITYALWTRSGVAAAITQRGARAFTVAEMLR